MKTSNYPDFWLDKPYYSLDAYCKKTYHRKVYKLALQAGLTCPNRDGTLGHGGCIFCSAGGSGDFALSIGTPEGGICPDCHDLIHSACLRQEGSPHIAYFQAFTNTYGPIPYLHDLYETVLNEPDIIGISIGTRPDCISQPILDLLLALRKRHSDKFIWIELGLQTMHDMTADYIRRGYHLDTFTDCMTRLHNADIPVIIHMIIGLPGESTEMLRQTVNYVNQCHPFGVKLQLLHILEHTDLATDYQNSRFSALSLENYIQLTALCLTGLSPDIVIHRVTGDGPKELTIAPRWSFDKKNVLNSLHRYLRENHLYQGIEYAPDAFRAI